MIKVIYSKDGEPISDFKVYEYVDSMIHFHKLGSNLAIQTASELCLMVFGLRVIEEKIPIDEVEFYFEDSKLNFDPYLGICDPEDKTIGFYSDVCSETLKIGYQKMREHAVLDKDGLYYPSPRGERK